MKTDDTDRAITEALAENGRATNSDIAAKAGVSEGTVRNRIARLVESGYLRVRGMLDPNQVTDRQLVFLGAKVAVSKDLRSAARSVQTLPYVQSVTIVSGRYDLLVEVFLPSRELISFISDHLSTCTSIASTESFVAMECVGKRV